MNKIDIFLKSFTSKDSLLPALAKPVMVGDRIYSTDARHLVSIPKDMTDTQYLEDSTFPDCEKVITGATKLDKPLFFDSKTLKETLDLIPLHNVYAECTQCEGEGTIECDHCGHFSDCEECNGSGETSLIIGKEIDNSEHRIKISEGLFNASYIKKILEANEIENSEIRILSNTPNRAMLVEIGRITILIMPQMQDPEAEYTIHEINTEPCKQLK
jgi:hypothetical protein